MSLELPVCSRRRSRRARRWATSIAGGLGALAMVAFVVPAAFGLSRYTVTDDAMGGTMHRGAAVFAKSLPVADLEIGDVITYPSPGPGGVLVTRRIADIRAGVIWTRSDSTGVVDPWTVTLERSTQARAVVSIPYAGYAYDAIDGGARRLWRTVSGLH